MNLALRDIRHSPTRFLLTCLGLSLLLGIVFSMIGIFRGLEDEALALVRSAGAELWVVEAGRLGPFAESSRLSGDTREAVARLSGVQAAGAVTYQTVEALTARGKRRLYLVGYEPGRPGGPPPLYAGRPITRSHYEMIVDRRAGLALGERVRIGRDVFTVVGLVRGQTASGGDPLAYVTLRDAQTLQFEPTPETARNRAARGVAPADQDIVNAVVVQLRPFADAAAVQAAIGRWKPLTVLSQSEQEQLLLHSVVDKARRQIGLFTVLLLTVSAVIIALIIHTMTLDKLKAIATLKLIGAPDRVIAGLIVQQAVALGAIGFLSGALLIQQVQDYFPRRIVLQPGDGLLLAAVVLLVCLLASTAGVRLALKVDPATALGG